MFGLGRSKDLNCAQKECNNTNLFLSQIYMNFVFGLPPGKLQPMPVTAIWSSAFSMMTKHHLKHTQKTEKNLNSPGWAKQPSRHPTLQPADVV